MTSNKNQYSTRDFFRDYLNQNLWPMIIVGCLSATAAINFAMLTIALNTKPDLVSESYYADGYNLKQIAAIEAASQRTGWKIELHELETDASGTTLQLSVTNDAGQPCDSIEGSVALYRPSDKSLDQAAVNIVGVGSGKYVFAVPRPLIRGAWQAITSLHRGQTTFETKIPFFLDR